MAVFKSSSVFCTPCWFCSVLLHLMSSIRRPLFRVSANCSNNYCSFTHIWQSGVSKDCTYLMSLLLLGLHAFQQKCLPYNMCIWIILQWIAHDSSTTCMVSYTLTRKFISWHHTVADTKFHSCHSHCRYVSTILYESALTCLAFFYRICQQGWVFWTHFHVSAFTIQFYSSCGQLVCSSHILFLPNQ